MPVWLWAVVLYGAVLFFGWLTPRYCRRCGIEIRRSGLCERCASLDSRGQLLVDEELAAGCVDIDRTCGPEADCVDGRLQDETA